MSKENTEKKKCGIIMPIASNNDYTKEHWKEVLNILVEAISETEFEPRLVSDDVAIGLIHERIVNNIYNDDIVVCDVSSKNPNVMFELGMRLAFDKPTIIIKDENTGYSFDTGVIEHINYPSSLRFNKIIEFKKELVKKLNATYKKANEEENYSPFLKSFGKTLVPAKINNTEVPETKYIIEKLENISRDIHNMKTNRNETFLYSLNENKELHPNQRRMYIKNGVREFIERNPNLDEDDVLNVINIIREEIADNTPIKPSLIGIQQEVKKYFNSKSNSL